MQIDPRVFVARLVEQRPLASSGRFLVAAELVVNSAHVVPCFGVVGSKVERASTGENCLDVAFFTIKLQAEGEIKLRRLRRCFIERLINFGSCEGHKRKLARPSLRFLQKFARVQVVRAQLQCALQERARLVGA